MVHMDTLRSILQHTEWAIGLVQSPIRSEQDARLKLSVSKQAHSSTFLFSKIIINQSTSGHVIRRLVGRKSSL